MTRIERIMELIEKGESVLLLSEEHLKETFDELLKFGLIDVVGEKVLLTPKGQEGMIYGLEKTLQKLKHEEELRDFSLLTQKRELKRIRLTFSVCIILVLSLLILKVTSYF